MGVPREVLTVTEDDSVAERIASAIELLPSVSAHRTCRRFEELTGALDDRAAAAVVVDIDASPADSLRRLAPLIDRYHQTRFVVLASERRDAWVQEAMHAGARDFIVKNTIAEILPPALDRLVGSVSPNGALPRLVLGVLPAGGGCGATTVAINLADELALLRGAVSLLIDLDSEFGSLSAYLGLSPEYGAADVLNDGDRIDTHLVGSTVASHGKRLAVLAGAGSTPLRFEHLPRAIRAARETYATIVIDAPRADTGAAELLARSSTLTLIVLEPDVEDVRIARGRIEHLLAAGIDADRLLPVLNRFRKRGSMVGLGAVKKALGVERMAVLGSDYRRAVASINYGKTLAETAPRSPLRRGFSRLAKAVHEMHAGAEARGR